MRLHAAEIRINVMKMIIGKGKGHTGGALSMVDLLTALYFGVKKVGPLHTIIYQNVSPIITAIVVFLMDDRAPSVVQVAGVFTIFLGVYLTRTSKRTADVQPIDP